MSLKALIPIGIFWLIQFGAYLTFGLDPVMAPRLALTALFLIPAYFLLTKSNSSALVSQLTNFKGPLFWLLLYTCLTLLSIPQARCFSEAWFDSCRTLMLFLGVLLFFLWREHNPNFLTNQVFVFFLVSLPLGIAGIIAFSILITSPGFTHEKLYTLSLTFANKNILAECLLLLFPWTVLAVFRFPKWRIPASLGAAFLLFLLVNLMTRSVWLGFCIAGLVWLSVSLFFKLKFPSGSWKFILFMGVIFCIAIGVYYGFDSGETYGKQLHGMYTPTYGSQQERISMWKNSLKIIRDNPLGIGPGNWQFEWGKYGTPGTRTAEGQVFLTRPHNDFLWVGSETGWAGLLSYLALAGCAFFGLLKKVASGKDRDHWLTALFGLTAYLVIAQFGFPRERTEETILFAFLISLSLPDIQKTSKNKNANILMLLGLFFCSLIISTTAIIRIFGENGTKKMIQAKMSGNWNNVIHFAAKTKNILYEADPTSTPLSWYEGSAWFIKGDASKACALYAEAYKINPTHLHILNNLGSCSEVTGESKSAEQYYREALTISPIFDEARINLAAVLYNEGKYQEAMIQMDSCSGDTSNAKWKMYRQAISEALQE
jgi:O-antigen ligase